MRFIGLLSTLLLASTSAAGASPYPWVPLGTIGYVDFANETTGSPVWVTIYTASVGPAGPWKIVQASCVNIASSASWTIAPTPYVKVRAEAKGGHAVCNTHTYWDGSLSKSASNDETGSTVGVKINSIPGGATKLSFQ